MTRKTRRPSPFAALPLSLSLALAFAAGPARAQAPNAAPPPTNPPATQPQPQPKRGIGERIGDAADRAGRSIRQGIRETTDSVHAMGVQARVYSRLHWDKALTDASLNVDVNRDGVAVLKGAVADAHARARAVELARETVGVSSIVDQLSVRGATTPAPSPADAAGTRPARP